MKNGKRAKIMGFFCVGRPAHGWSLDIFLRREELAARGEGATWEGVRLGGRKKFFVKREITFARGRLGVFEGERGRGGKEELSWKGERLYCRKLENMENGKDCA